MKPLELDSTLSGSKGLSGHRGFRRLVGRLLAFGAAAALVVALMPVAAAAGAQPVRVATEPTPATAWSVSLTAGAAGWSDLMGHAVTQGTSVTLTAVANQTVSSTVYDIDILDSGANVVASCVFGTTCSHAVTSSSAGSRTYHAVVVSFVGGSVPVATSSSVTVARSSTRSLT